MILTYQRRIRELRGKEGYKILTHRDRDYLKPGQYLLEDPHPMPVIATGIDQKKRARILSRNGYTCQVCGAGGGEVDPYGSSRRVRLQIDHIIPKKEGGTDQDENLRVLCSTCNEGRSNLEKPPDELVLNLLEKIRRAPRKVQLEVLRFLKSKFECDNPEERPDT
ncbi:MAG: HNH endonuclease [Nitrospira sp.]|nr:MAG: HNH endonuclease [Nitrospira sp.]